MGIGMLQSAGYRTDYAGYAASKDQKVNDFYSGLSSATEKSQSKTRGDVLGLTMISYSADMSYGMSAYYSDHSTEKDPIIRVSSNYGGEDRVYDVHVNDVNPRSATQLEMFALSCYQDDQGITVGGTYGSFTRMKAYASNASDIGIGVDLMNPENASAKLDWVAMLQGMSGIYVKNSQAYSQYLDCDQLASVLSSWADRVERIKNGESEPSYQTGGQSFSEKEWKQLIGKLDKNIEGIKKEQKERFEKQKEEKNKIIAEEKISKEKISKDKSAETISADNKSLEKNSSEDPEGTEDPVVTEDQIRQLVADI